MIWVLLGLLSLHGLLSVLNQFTRLQPTLRRFNRFGLLPHWSFFAPNPGTSDYHLLVRRKLLKGTITDWVEVSTHEKRRTSHLLWNPSKVRRKCVSDCVSALLRLDLGSNENENFIQVSWPYIKLAQLAFENHEFEGNQLRQFAIVASRGIEQRTLHPLFISKWHR